MIDLRTLWSRRKFPDADCIVHTDGTMTIMRSEQHVFDNEEPWVLLSPIAKTTLRSYFDYNSISDLVPLTTLFRAEEEDCWLEGGESEDGRAGWFAFSSGDAFPAWIAFFRESNPFIGGALSPGTIAVQNNHDQHWSLSTETPETIEETPQSADGSSSGSRTP